MACRQHHQDYHPRRILPGSLIQVRMQRRTPESSADMCLDRRTSQRRFKPVVPEIVYPIQHGITPKRLLLPHSDTEILSHIDDDISSIRDGYTVWVMSDAGTTRERHMACKRLCSTCIPRGQREKESFSQPKYRFDTGVPNRLLEQTRISILSWA